MDNLSTSVFFVLLKEVTPEEGINFIEREILEELC